MDPIADDDTATTFSRRRILAVGGFSVAMAAVVAACAPDKPKPQVPEAGVAPTTTAIPEQHVTDGVLLRTASSMQHSLIDAYAKVLATGTLPPATAALVRQFAEHHTSQATFLEDTTRDIGVEPYTQANEPLDTSVIEPALKSIADAGNKPDDFSWLVYGLENVATGTLQSFVPLLTVPALRGAIMSVGAPNARQAAIAASLIQTVQIVPIPADLAAAVPATTTTTIAGATTTTTPANLLIPVYQVPGPFGPLTPVSVAIAGSEDAWNLLGPNSYEYLDEPTT